MASTSKAYELLFLMKAKMDSSFNNGFNSATRQLQQLEEKIKQYQNTLGKVDKYRVMEGKLKDLTDKGKGASGSADVLRGRMEMLRNELKNAGVDIDQLSRKEGDLGETERELTKKIEDTAEEYKKIQEEIEKTAQAEQDFLDNTNALMALGMVAEKYTKPLEDYTKAVADCVQGAAQLQFTMSAVGAISGATGDETDRLTGKAKELGATTIYTASEIASAMESTALAGWSVNQMVDGMASVTALAAASGESLTGMASIVSDALNAFGLSGEKAVTEFSDVLTKAATSSNTNVSLMGESLSYVESTAGNLGYTIQDVSTILAVMANNALKGSVSGSALNTSLTRMSGANGTAAKEMDRLGLSMYNASDSVKPLLQFMTELRGKFRDGSMTAQEMQISAYKLAGQRGMRGLLSIVNTSDEAWQQMINDVNDFDGASKNISGRRLDNFTGQVYLLTSAWDALKTSIGEQFLPAAQDGASILTELVTRVNDLVTNSGAAQAGIVGITGAVGGLVLAGKAMGALGSLATVAQLLVQFGGGVGSVGWIASLASAAPAIVAAAPYIAVAAAGVGALAGAGVWYYETYGKASETALEFSSSVQEMNTAIEESRNGFEAEGATVEEKYKRYKDLANQIADAKEKLKQAQSDRDNVVNDKSNYKTSNDGYRSTLTVGAQNTIRSYDSSIKSLTASISELEAEYQELGADAEVMAAQSDEAFNAIAANAVLSEAAINSLQSAVDDYASVWSEVFGQAAKSLEDSLGLMKEATEATETSVDDMQSNLNAQLEAAQAYKDNLDTIFAESEKSGIDISPILEDLTNGSADAMGAAQAIADSIKNGSNDALQSLVDTTSSIDALITSLKEDITSRTPEVQDAWNDLLSQVTSASEEATNMGIEDGQQLVAGLVEGMLEDSAVIDAGTKMFDDANTAIRAAAGIESPSKIMKENGEFLDQGLVEGIRSGAAAVNSAMRTLGSSAIASFKASSFNRSNFYSYGAFAVEGAVQGIRSKIGALKKAAEEAANAANAGYKNAAKINSPSKVWRGYGEGNIEGAVDGVKGATPDLARASAEAANVANASFGEGMAVSAVHNNTNSSSSSVVNVNYAPVINGTGGDVSGALAGHDRKLIAMIENVLNQREADQARRAYA